MPKKGGKKGGKKKAPSYLTDAESLEPFGVSVGDIIVTPMGMEVTVVGVKKSPYDLYYHLDGQLWATFPGGYTSPLRPKSAVQLEEQGYRRAHEGTHILRNKTIFEVKRQELLDSHNPILLEAEAAAKEAKKEAKAAKKKKK